VAAVRVQVRGTSCDVLEQTPMVAAWRPRSMMRDVMPVELVELVELAELAKLAKLVELAWTRA
jgi:hypothetical protein